MNTAMLVLLSLQIALGALDNILHHEITERLPSKPSARHELELHCARESIYAVLFPVFAWTEPAGVFALAVIGLLFCEVLVTIADFIEEDRTRHLPTFERVLHTVLALLYGSFLLAAVPWLMAQSGSPTTIVIISHGVFSWFFTLASLGVAGFAIRNAIAVRNLGQHRPQPNPVPASGRTVLVTGGTGFIGAALVERLSARGDRIFVLTRDARQARALPAQRVTSIESLKSLPVETRIDAVVNLAGAPVIGLPWTPGRRRAIWRSRIGLTNELVDWMNTLDVRPKVLVSGSAIGIYGNRGDETLTEASAKGTGYAADLCHAWESAASRASEPGSRVVCLRIGLVLDRSGGALPLMALPVRLAAGAILGAGNQWMSWILRDDLLRMIVTAVDNGNWQGPVNAVAPEPVRHRDLQISLARTLARPLWLRVPAFVLRRALGEMSSIFLYSQRVAPRAAVQLGFAFDVHWAADALMLQLGSKQRLHSSPPMVETGTNQPSTTGSNHDHHNLRRAFVPLRAQGEGVSRRKTA